jgi:hypothetical protein
MNFVVVTLREYQKTPAGIFILKGETIMGTGLSCFIWGIIGVIFGLFALLFPDPEIMLVTFYGLFLVLIITSGSDESLVWFGLSAGLLTIGVLSFLVQTIVGIIFMLIVAGIAFYNGFTDITLALTNPVTRYLLIPGMFITGAAILAGLLWYIPVMSENLVIVILGTFAFVFGLFSILMGYFQRKGQIPEGE